MVERYASNGCEKSMYAISDGKWVRYADYAKLEEALRECVEEIQYACEEDCEWPCREFVDCKTRLVLIRAREVLDATS